MAPKSRSSAGIYSRRCRDTSKFLNCPIIVRRRNLATIARPPALSPLASSPRAMLFEAHDSNIWALTFHPFGHLLVSASNDRTTCCCWACECPRDSAFVFSPSKAKSTAAGPDDDLDGKPEDVDDALAVSGFGGFGGRYRVILLFMRSALALAFIYLFLSLAHALKNGERRSYFSASIAGHRGQQKESPPHLNVKGVILKMVSGMEVDYNLENNMKVVHQMRQ